MQAWAAAAGGSERALALTILAELHGAKSDFESADAALRDAALADNKLGLIRIVREIIGRSAGADSRFARSGDELTESALVSAAKEGL